MRVGWKPKHHDPRVASVRFRCLTPLGHLRREGFPVEVFKRKRLETYDAVIFSKLYEHDDQEMAYALRGRGARVLLDLCDNHFYNPKNLPIYAAAARDLRIMAELANRIICCSPALAEVIREELSPSLPPLVVGDAVEAFDARVRKRPSGNNPFRILWYGLHGSPNAPSGMEDVRRINPQLRRVAGATSAELVVVSNNQEVFARLREDLPIAARYRAWSTDAFAEELSRADVVVIPVSSNPYTRCKSNNRLATALWHGVPVIADSIPAYQELSNYAVLDDWDRGFQLALARDPSLIARTEAGKAVVRTRFNARAISLQWRAAIEGELTRGRVRELS
jgi:hypothetical protein